MPSKSELLREKIHKATLKSLRKIVAAKGKVSGHFYFAGNLTSKEAAVLVTLTTKDPKGALAASQGKALRKDIAKSKFSLGEVSSKDGKLTFLIKKGNADKATLQKSFKNTLAAMEGMNFLKKAVFRTGDPDEPVGDDEEAVSIDDLALTTGENAELDRALRSMFSREEAVELSASIPAMEELNAHLKAHSGGDAIAEASKLAQKMLSDTLASTGDDHLLDVVDSAVGDFLKLALSDVAEASAPLSADSVVSLTLQLQGLAGDYAELLRNLDRIEDITAQVLAYDTAIGEAETALAGLDGGSDAYTAQHTNLENLLESRNALATRSSTLRDAIETDSEALEAKLKTIRDSG